MSDLITKLREASPYEYDVGMNLHTQADDRIAELEADNTELTRLTNQNAGIAMAKTKEVARLQAHIRAIAEHHERETHGQVDREYFAYHLERRDRALSGLEGE